MTSSSKGPVALITGAGSGIGLACARRFAAAGYRLALLDIDPKAVEAACAALRDSGTEALPFVGSVADETAVESAVDAAEQDLGPIELLINSAGVASNKPTFELSLADWERVVSINLTGTFLVSRIVGAKMAARSRGVILNLGSMFGTVAAPRRAGYCGTKAGVDMLGRVLAIEWAEHGIRVNTIAPGYVRTPFVDDLIAEGRMDEPALLGRTPLKRMAAPEEIADLAIFLASDAAAFITGQTIGIDGGWTAYGYV
ncbi:SDR family NAD(P)-dependent oxidoreductase [Kaistia dalseonensis]|uniref:NAD(P)-dependent dehydrogenase (Short-subunit alcohol dehydrogenase family) n=1 Tax=Kaistia dalseonensis TaxID=410840 RepID=A0ABU0H4Q3_9HYPH|nr:SDR family oxidoreductase [Kaistia dalseonensis]MCX5494428.1 SDR family NAD(P)-dependent oxidoreductase [Kaistia dalseonensis]MDQ0437007.1 NAD(P)-dependent dehydrogenase (short-subunit alcohol dehydrogenase family) [Kaistia dalseonensis]